VQARRCLCLSVPSRYVDVMKSRFLFAFTFAVLVSDPASAALTRAEQAMVATVDAEQQRTLAMLERWVDQNSGTMNKAGVEAVREMVEPEFRALGFKTQWIDMSAVGRAGHLVAHHVGSRRGKRLLLIGHLDTVFEADSPFQRWVREGDRARGPGAGDDKGGDAVIIAALRAMKAAGTLRKANITVFLTGDEEDAGRPLAISRRDLMAEGKRADVALDFEDLAVADGPNGPMDMGSTARRSAGSWTLTVTGRSAHSAGVGAGD
jgi:glutamate carboxypeptidase